MAVLAYGDPALLEKTLKNLKRYTDYTLTNRDELQSTLKTVREIGFGIVDQGYEENVFGIGVPLFDSSDKVAGSVAVASVATRVNADAIALIKRELIKAARQITQSWGGSIPDDLDQIWTDTLSSLSNDLDFQREATA